VLNIPLPEIILYQPRVCALVDEGKAARMANLVTILFTSVRIEADCIGWP
jgi:hypothetical protein